MRRNFPSGVPRSCALSRGFILSNSKGKLASRVFNKDYPLGRFGTLYAEASWLNFDRSCDLGEVV
jgi:hypothetical protein